MVRKNLSRFEATRSSNSGSHCNQRGFHPFLAEVRGLALFFYPLFSFPLWLVGRGMLGWSQSWWWCGLFLPWEAMKSCFPLHTRNQRAGKVLLVWRAKCRSQPTLGPKNFPLEFLSSCAYSGIILCFSLLLPGCGHDPGTLPTATSTRLLPSSPWWDGVHGPTEGGHLILTLRQG